MRRAETRLQELRHRADGTRGAASSVEDALGELRISEAVARASLEPQLPAFIQLWVNDPRISGLSLKAHRQLRVMLRSVCEGAAPVAWPACVLVFWETNDLERAGFAGEVSVSLRFFDDNAGLIPRPELARWCFRYPKEGHPSPSLGDYLSEFRARKSGASATGHSGDQ